MKRVIRFLILSVVILSFTTCHKYPQGGWSNKAYQKVRGNLFKNWKVKSYKINQVETILDISSDQNYTYPVGKFLFNKDFDDSKVFDCSSEIYTFTCTLTDKNAVLTMNEQRPGSRSCASSICQFNVFNPNNKVNGENINWKIIRLTKTEFKLALVDQFIYEIGLIAI